MRSDWAHVKHSFDSFGQRTIGLFHHRYTKLLWLAGVLSLALVPAAALGWWNAPTDTAVETASPVAEPAPVTPAAVTPEQSAPLSSSQQSSISTDVSTDSTAPNAAPTTHVKVNGVPVPVPQNGSVHKVINDAGGTTKVDISVNNTSSGDSQTSSFSSVQMSTSSETSTVNDSSP